MTDRTLLGGDALCVKVLALGQLKIIDRDQLCFESLVLLLELHGHVMPGCRPERHPLALALDHKSSGHRLHSTGRQPREHLLPQDR